MFSPAPDVESVSPSVIPADTYSLITISGGNFGFGPATVFVDGQECENVTYPLQKKTKQTINKTNIINK